MKWQISLLASFLALGAMAQDTAIYKNRELLPREKEEDAARDRFLAERQGREYVQAEARPGKYLSLDFSRIERPGSSRSSNRSGIRPPSASGRPTPAGAFRAPHSWKARLSASRARN